MKAIFGKFLFALLLARTVSLSSAAQTPESVIYTDATAFPLYGKASDNTSSRYERLPASFEVLSRPGVWYLGRHSAGLYLRFRSDSPVIWVKWKSSFMTSMNNMTSTGIRGLDLYTFLDGKWRFAGSARPSENAETEYLVLGGMDRVEREYMLYLSLYDGVSSLSIGIEGDSTIGQPELPSPVSEKPVVMYGTSILQGGCANRPGMAHTNILARMLDREVINLGFSGNALLDFEIAGYMASVEDPGLFVLDYVPNASAEQIDEKGEKFFRMIRDAHPDVPVVFIEDPIFPHTIFDHAILEQVTQKNEAQARLYHKLKDAGEKYIYYIESEGMIGDDGEATVDNIHFTDLGMVRYAEFVYPTLKKALRKAGVR